MYRPNHIPTELPVHWDTFLDTVPDKDNSSNAQVTIIPVPYDSTTSYKTGARDGPGAIIRASRHMEDYDLELNRDISEIGIYTMPEITPDYSSPQATIALVTVAVNHVLALSKMPVVLGGDHIVGLGAVTAVSRRIADVSVLYLDAHADMRDTYMGTAWGHGSVARRTFDICPVTLVGVRSLSEEEKGFIDDNDIPVFYESSLRGDINKTFDDIVANLTANVYISIDLDVLDPSIMPAVGTPEPGGMSWLQITGLLKAVGLHRRIVGFDIVELSPREGPESCAYTAAKLAYKLMGYATLSRK